jgi:hypothetical protein
LKKVHQSSVLENRLHPEKSVSKQVNAAKKSIIKKREDPLGIFSLF